MQHRLRERHAPETINLFALIVVMAVFGAGLFYVGELFSVPPTVAQFAVPNLNP
jgi:hypothetical protein